MRIEEPPPRRPPAPLPPQGSLYHQTGEWGRSGGALLSVSPSPLSALSLTLLFSLSPLPLSPPPFLSPPPLPLCRPPLPRPPAPPGPPGTPPGEGLLLQENVSAEIRALLSSYYSDR